MSLIEQALRRAQEQAAATMSEQESTSSRAAVRAAVEAGTADGQWHTVAPVVPVAAACGAAGVGTVQENVQENWPPVSPAGFATARSAVGTSPRHTRPVAERGHDATPPRPTAAATTPSAWRPSLASIMLVALTVFTATMLMRPDWGEGFRETIAGRSPADVQRVTAQALSGSTGSTMVNPGQLEASHSGTRSRGEGTWGEGLRSAGPQDATSIIRTGESRLGEANMAPEVDLERLLAEPRQDAAPPAGRGATISARPGPASIESTSVLPTPPARPSALPNAGQRSTPRGSVARPAALERLHLEGVMVGGAVKLAVLNGAILEVGQQINGVIITAITAQGIAVEIDGRTYRVPITGPADK